nr:MAG TPA: hypothetical protein [Caudoviricetes sp.]
MIHKSIPFLFLESITQKNKYERLHGEVSIDAGF